MSWLIRDVLIEAEQRSKADAPSAYSQDSAVALSSASKNRSRQASRVSTNLGIRSPIFRVLRRPIADVLRKNGDELAMPISRWCSRCSALRVMAAPSPNSDI